MSATREIAINRHNKNNLSNIFSAVTFIKFCLLVISFIILVLCMIFVPKLHENWLVFMLSFLMVVGNAIYPVWFFQGMERMKYITFLNILSKTIFLILIFIFVKKSDDYIIVPLLNSMGFLVSGAIGMYFAIKHLGAKLYIPRWRTVKKQFKYSSEFFLSRASVSAYTNTNSFCLGLIGSSVMVGYYVAAEKIYQAINGLCYPLTNALYPFVAKNKDIKTFKKIFNIAVIIIFFICACMFILAKPIITIFYEQEMENAYKIFRIFCIIASFDIPAILVGYPLLGAMGYSNIANYSVILASIVHILGLAALYFTGHLNIYSIALMVLVTEAVVFIVRFGAICKYKLLRTT